MKFWYCLFVLLLFSSVFLNAQDSTSVPIGTDGERILNGRHFHRGRFKKEHWNRYDLGFTTVKIGGGILLEYGTFIQDANSAQQVALEPQFKVRDSRIVLAGKLNTKREITWKMGIMYDGVTSSWFIRESGVLLKFPEIRGSLFVGRTKEGYSMSKVMNGYSIPFLERSMSIDVIPILADGIKYLGYLPKQRLLWNVGAYADWLSKTQTFSTYQWQLDARVAFLPVYENAVAPILHIGVNYRYGQVAGNQLQVRSRPEANTAPYFIDTKAFGVSSSNHYGIEAFYRVKSLFIGTEYNFHVMNADTSGNPVFKGGEVYVAYTLTGEVRPYLTESGIFTFLKVKKPVFKGGFGAWEILARFSALNLNAEKIKGGDFWRFTPMLNWYLNDAFRLTFAYGVGVLDRFALKGTTQFFQTRLVFLI